MSSLTLMAAAAPTRLDPIRLFLDADIVVQLVMAGLLLASVWVWMIIVSFSLRMAKLRSRTIEYENEFWQADSFDRFTSERGSKDIPAARVAQAAVGEYRRSTKGAVRDPEALRGRHSDARLWSVENPVNDGVHMREDMRQIKMLFDLVRGQAGLNIFVDFE